MHERHQHVLFAAQCSSKVAFTAGIHHGLTNTSVKCRHRHRHMCISMRDAQGNSVVRIPIPQTPRIVNGVNAAVHSSDTQNVYTEDKYAAATATENPIPHRISSQPPSPPEPEPEPEPELPSWMRLLLGTTAQGSAARVALFAAVFSYFLANTLDPAGVSTGVGVENIPVTLEAPSTDVSTGMNLAAMLSDFVTGPHFHVSIGMGASAFIQALTGFGFAIVSVGALTQLDWIAHSSVFDTVQPVAATLGAFTGWALLLPEIKHVKWKNLRTLLIATSVTTPLGALLLEHVDTVLVIRALGALISGYVAYSVLGVAVPKQLGGEPGAWIMGLLAGALGGAFDITGPPLVVHAEATGWETKSGEFRRNVLSVVSVNSTLVVLWDLVSGRLNDFYYFDFLKYGMPWVVAGILAGNSLSKRLDAAAFKKIVLGTCLVLGIKLLLS